MSRIIGCTVHQYDSLKKFEKKDTAESNEQRTESANFREQFGNEARSASDGFRGFDCAPLELSEFVCVKFSRSLSKKSSYQWTCLSSFSQSLSGKPITPSTGSSVELIGSSEDLAYSAAMDFASGPLWHGFRAVWSLDVTDLEKYKEIMLFGLIMIKSNQRDIVQANLLHTGKIIPV
ncbi:hypothetical protein T265_03676 [Opisthorchis viverrini]|uniref:Uncharacterized protein n=1 Tax=Opisthorchis viverrini TaxID=6198 RepID=A0A074ZRQ1_OPIVI|nr:hypothetical protein T265_03676 [Opisthorchis viverrini]KER29766.1 hypothetical protein T265_03676 [Opisthorchis viverrini]